MEPRTSSAKNKLKAIEILSENKIPVNVMVAPIIPGLNSDEPLTILKLFLKQERKVWIYLVRLNDSVEPVFVNWIENAFPIVLRKFKSDPFYAGRKIR
jgi:DNA repair photolyase